ncbi:DUF308 domain-containing protein [Rhodanobacter sp. Col0626]|uniref:DUF308 domain-containing protein n=1 Tax=Rhodanobacter sp. Col0626 TaxID=3415679 RepID=UPI003CE818AD
MTTTTANRSILATPTRLRSANRSSLLRLYLIRGVLAVLWAAAFAKGHDPLDALAITLLVIYPLIDAVSSLIDYRSMPRDAERRITAFNAVLSTLAAIAMGVAGSFGVPAALAVFGAWAVIAGAAQLVLGLRRRGRELGKQWPMLIAGGLSFLVGISYGIRAFGEQPSLAVLSVYATGGGVFFIIQAGLLAWRARQQRCAAN